MNKRHSVTFIEFSYIAGIGVRCSCHVHAVFKQPPGAPGFSWMQCAMRRRKVVRIVKNASCANTEHLPGSSYWKKINLAKVTTPESTLLGVGMQKGGHFLNPAAGGFKISPPSFAWRCLFANKSGGGWGIYFFLGPKSPCKGWNKLEQVQLVLICSWGYHLGLHQ